MLEINDKAPAFQLPYQDNKFMSASDLMGKKTVLFFYPKDNTPGCTTEANEFSELVDDFERAGAQVVGISKDTLKKHENFIEKYDLKLALLSDHNGTMCEDYGVWQEKKMYGKSFMGIVRTTFIIDESGNISHVWHKVKPKGHALEVLEVLKNGK